MPATTAALRAALAPLVAGRAVHITVVDLDAPDEPTTPPFRGPSDPE